MFRPVAGCPVLLLRGSCDRLFSTIARRGLQGKSAGIIRAELVFLPPRYPEPCAERLHFAGQMRKEFRGSVAERSKAPVLKTGRRGSVSWVRIPPGPPSPPIAGGTVVPSLLSPIFQLLGRCHFLGKPSVNAKRGRFSCAVSVGAVRRFGSRQMSLPTGKYRRDLLHSGVRSDFRPAYALSINGLCKYWPVLTAPLHAFWACQSAIRRGQTEQLLSYKRNKQGFLFRYSLWDCPFGMVP